MKRQDSDQKKKRQEGKSFLQFSIIGFINSSYLQSVISKVKRLTRPVAFAFAFVTVNLFLVNEGLSQTVIVNPTSPFTVPSGVSSIKVEVWGGGGGGGGGTGANIIVNITGRGGGGGGGAYNVATFTTVPGHTFNITLGAGGTVGATAAGGNGGTTTVSGVDGTVSANGGGGGGRGNLTNGTAGAASTGGFNNGGAGAAGSGTGSGGGGGGAGNLTPTGAGNGVAAATITGGNGGTGNPNATPYKGGQGASGSATSNSGAAGSTPGGGGSGGIFTGNGNQSGTVGGAGQIVITYTPCTQPAAPTVTSPVIYCQNATASPLTATGSNLLWYTVPNGGAGSATAPTPSTTSPGTTSYYVSQHLSPTEGCESPRSEIVVNVAEPPTSTFTKNDVQCFNTNTGQIVITAVGGTAPFTYSIDNGATYPNNTGTFNGLGAGPYKIRIKDSLGCESRSVQ